MQRVFKTKLRSVTVLQTSLYSSNGKNQNEINISNLRKAYNTSDQVLLEKNIKVKDPFSIFGNWLELACKTKTIEEPTAMTVATVSPKGTPSARLVLLKQWNNNGFTFFTSSRSIKAQHLLSNPHAAVVFYWEKLNRSIRIEGKVSMLPEEQTKEYFSTRPISSQIAAHVSENQSSPILNRDVLLQRFENLEKKFSDYKSIPKPDFWCGYTVKPNRFEFWQGQTTRMHDRIVFQQEVTGQTENWLKGDNEWYYQRLEP